MRRALAGGFFVCVVAIACLVVVEGKQSSSREYLVQLRGPVLDRWKAQLTAAGAELEDYVPQFAFRARMSPDEAARVRRLAFVTAVEALRADRKLAPRLRRNGSLPYVVRIDRGAMPANVEAALRGAGVQVQRRGSQLMIVADSAMLELLTGIDGVASIENFAPRIKHNEFGGGAIMGSNAANANGYDGSSQTIAIADTGLGTGTFEGAHPDIAPARISSIFNWPGTPDFCYETIANDGPRDVDSGHGTHVTTAALGAGNGAGQGRGTAPAANLVFQAIENYAVPSLLCSLFFGVTDGYYLVGIPDNVGDLYGEAYQQSARVHSDSWGAEVAGAYTADSANTDAFVWSHRDLTVVFSAGNSGSDADADGVIDGTSINAPGTAKNVITVGASENDRQSHYDCDASLGYTTCAAQGGQNNIFTWGAAWPDRYTANPIRDDPSAGNAEQMAAFSSRGPTIDGRIKPDVVAPGTWNLSGYADPFQQGYDGSPNPVNGTFQYDGWGFPASSTYKYMGGTSMAAPLVAGGAAVVRDFYLKSRGHEASAALVKAALINSAVDLLDENNDGVPDNFFPIPNAHEGWGRVDLVNATDGSDLFFDESAQLSTGLFASYDVEVTASGSPLKITLAWTDFAASTSAQTSLVNDLDLEVVAPDGTIYRGNVFTGGWSAAGGSADRLNNVENAYIFSAAAGTWTVNVRGYNIPQGPQTYALVIDAPTPAALPVVRVTADDDSASEAGLSTGTLRFTRSGDTTAALTVAYTVSGTAASGVDFVPLSGFVTIPEGAVDATVVVTPLDDPYHELPETVVVNIDATAAYTAGSPSVATVTITSDDPAPDLTISALTVPALGTPGTAIVANSTTRNQGAGMALNSLTGFYLSLNSAISPDDVFLGEQPIGVLTPGGQAPLATSLAIPASVAPGSYYVIGKADWNAAIVETNDTNNHKPSSARINIGPDLLVTALTAPSTAAAGEPIVVTDTTKNQGATAVGSTVTAFYLSFNTTLDGADLLLGSRTIANLNGGAMDVASTSLAIPASTPVGTYYVLAQADHDGWVTEYLETNNVKISAAVKIGADLSVTVLTAPANAGAGQSIVVNETTANLGAADADAAVTRYYFSSNQTLDPSDMLLGSRATPYLDAGTVSAATVTLTIPAAVTGSYWLIANADDAQEIAETSETNNLKKVKIDVGPDLVVAYLEVPALAAAGGLVNVLDTTGNQGGGTAAATQTSFYLSANTALDAGDVLLGTRGVPDLNGGQDSNVSTPLTIPAATAVGSYYVIAKADHGSAVVELLETNNNRTSTVMKIGPDLTVSALTAPATVVRGVAFTITDTTRNLGGGSTVVTTTTSYYLSVNGTWDTSDVLLSSRTVGVLGGVSEEAGSVSVTFPVSQATGYYYLIAKSDNGSVVVELLETNNTRVKSLRINP
ncbi:MAG: S8 family serine peptidase [Cyanobacteria bacterium]|nr:S8 family serine peptidase [Cyanobacteriota bacterium]